MSHSLSAGPSLPSSWPPSGYVPYGGGYRYRYGDEDCPARRGVGEVLWSLTATYLAALIAYGQLQYSFQGERSVLKITYKLVILVIFPLYPACSLLAEVIRSVQAWRQGRRDRMFLFSRIIGLRVFNRQDGPSESLDNRHMGSYIWGRRERRTSVRIALVVILLLTSSQCLGTLVRTISRLFIHHYGRTSGMRAFLAEDFESFYLSIGTLGVLIKSWLAFIVNVEWRRDIESAPRSLDMSSRTQRRRSVGIFPEGNSHLSPTEIISEIFMEFQTRLFVLLALYIISWIVLGILARNALVVFAAWTCVTVLAVAWLKRSEAEAVPGGKEVFVSGFCACFFFLFPRAKFYINQINWTGKEIYWIPRIFPWPLIVLAVVIIGRTLLLHHYNMPYSSWQSKISHLCLVILGTLLLIVLPAYIYSAGMILDNAGWRGCDPEVRPDPIWVPSF